MLVPTLASEILAGRDTGSAKNASLAPWSLKGFALGNDCPGNRVFTCTPYSGWAGTQVATEFRFRHGMVSEADFTAVSEACADDWARSMEDSYNPPESTECRALLETSDRPMLSKAGDTYQMGGGKLIAGTTPTLQSIPLLTHPFFLALFACGLLFCHSPILLSGYFLYDTCPEDDLVTAIDPKSGKPQSG